MLFYYSVSSRPGIRPRKNLIPEPKSLVGQSTSLGPPLLGLSSQSNPHGRDRKLHRYLVESVKKRISKGNGDATQRAEIWCGRYEKRKAAWKDEALARKDQKPIDTRWVTHELAQVLPPEALVVEETITHRLSIHRYLDMLKPGSFFAGCIGGLGTGTGTALGVKAAFPKRPVLCLIGDGAFNYDPGLAALGVCQEHQFRS